jgi:hypothetical protein
MLVCRAAFAAFTVASSYTAKDESPDTSDEARGPRVLHCALRRRCCSRERQLHGSLSILVPLRLSHYRRPLHADLPLKLGARRVPHRFRELILRRVADSAKRT